MTGLLATLFYLTTVFTAVETEITWSENSEADLAGYKLYVGKAPRQYTQVIDVGSQSRYNFTLTETGVTYYFAVVAYDSSGNQSDYSEEVSAIIEDNGGGDTDPPGDPISADQKVYNYPNPFIAGTQETHLRHAMDTAGPVTIEIFNINNELVRTLENQTLKTAGIHTETVWNGRSDDDSLVPQGVYFARIMNAKNIRIIKIAVTR